VTFSCRSSRFPLLAVVIWSLTTACTTWEETRTNIVDPLNQLVHTDYPNTLKEGTASDVALLFSPALRDWAEQDAREILGRFDRVDRTRCVIHDATAPDGTGAVRTECVLRVDGENLGEKITWEQERVITARPEEGVWSITKVEKGMTNEISGGGPTFAEEATQRGLIATNRSRGALSWSGEEEIWVVNGGVAVSDVDGDDDDDLLMISGDRLRLFRNDVGEFTDITAASGIVTPPTGDCRCGYFADIDNDGDQDLFVAVYRGENLLFENVGGAKFREVPVERSGLVTPHGQTAAACFGDFDDDGDLDLVLANGQDMYAIHPDPECNARNGHPDQFFRNNGDGTFSDTSDEVGLGGTGWALACAVSDFDRDGDLDLYIANDIGEDFVYQNGGDGTFEDVTEDAGFSFVGSSMSADFGDVNGDGWPDVYISGMASNSRWMLRQPAFPLPVPFPMDLLFRPQVLRVMWEMFHGNRLYLNNHDGTFHEVSIETRSYWLGWGWSGVFLDYDNDGLLDIYGANGFWTGKDAADC